MILKNHVGRLWIFDFDGTVSDIVQDRRKAHLNPDCYEMLEKLVRTPRDRVAILSSRTLPDLLPRVAIPGIYLGANNGLIWHLPDGQTREKGGNEEILRRRRDFILPKIEILTKYSGIEIEDKTWSIAVHVRKTSEGVKREVRMLLEEISPFSDFRKLFGPEVIEVLFFSEFDKAFGVRNLCEFLKYEPEPKELIYSGDGENDLSAMQWTLFLKGIVFTVGDYPLITGSYLAAAPADLAEMVFKIISGDD